MNNENTIATLKKILPELKKRLNELNTLGDRRLSSAPFHKRPTIRNQIAQEIGTINMHILHLGTIIDDRELRAFLGDSVRHLSATRKRKLKDALERVSKDIAATNTLKAGLKIAREISTAANKAANTATV